MTTKDLVLRTIDDKTKYDALEVGHAMVEDNSIEKGLYDCIEKHNKIFDEDEYCVGFVIASDPLLKGLMRRKFFAMLYLPSPRPEQAVFLYNKKLGMITKRLWVLPAAASANPDAWTMERLYLTRNVPKQYLTMKAWSHAFYEGCFWEFVRHHHKIEMLSEHEYLKLNREKLVKACRQEITPGFPHPLDLPQVPVEQVIHPNISSVNKYVLNRFGQA